MDHLPDLAIALARWLDGPVTTLLALVAGYFGARLIGAGAQKRPAADPGTDGGHPVAPGRRGTDPQAEPLDGDTLESLESPTRLYEMRAQLERLEQENRYLEQAAAHRGADIQVGLTISFEEAVFGAEKDVEITRLEVCETCDGSRMRDGQKPPVCSVCNGVGQVRRAQQTILGQFMTSMPCSACGGEGVGFPVCPTTACQIDTANRVRLTGGATCCRPRSH